MAPLDVDAFDKPWSFFKKPFINTTIFPRYLPQVPLTRVLQVDFPVAVQSPWVLPFVAAMASRRNRAIALTRRYSSVLHGR
jgi:hypothetical protein